MNNTGIIILAAGNASRYGGVKQLLHFNKKTLLQHVIDEAVESGALPIVVVTGANADEIAESISENTVEVVVNENWKDGMASSILAGVKKAITINNDIENIIIAVSDQPFVTKQIFQQLYQKQLEGTRHIIASAYADTIGVPALFKQKYFDALMSLQGEEGAKKIIIANDDVTTIDFPQGVIDIDTKKDYEDLLDRQKHVL